MCNDILCSLVSDWRSPFGMGKYSPILAGLNLISDWVEDYIFTPLQVPLHSSSLTQHLYCRMVGVRVGFRRPSGVSFERNAPLTHQVIQTLLVTSHADSSCDHHFRKLICISMCNLVPSARSSSKCMTNKEYE
jgi:hypothetical protein